jgi:hypothetical protein
MVAAGAGEQLEDNDGPGTNDGSFAQGGIVNRTKNADGGLNYLLGF